MNEPDTLGFDHSLIEQSGEWKLTAELPAQQPPEQAESETAKSSSAHRTQQAAYQNGRSIFRNISFLLLSSIAGGSAGTWAMHALSCDGAAEKGVAIVATAEAATATANSEPQTAVQDSQAAARTLQAANPTQPASHRSLPTTHYTPYHVLTPLEERYFSKFARNNPGREPVLYCRQDESEKSGKRIVLYNDLADVMRQPVQEGLDCAHLYMALKGKYFYVSPLLAEDSDRTVRGLLGSQGAKELDYRVERNGRFLKQDKPHGIKVGDTIHIAPYKDGQQERQELGRREQRGQSNHYAQR